ncbi:MAG TPA: YceI family protein [Rhizomicrobium sp.]
MRRIAVAALAVGLSACPVLANVSTDPAQSPSGTYSVDVNHTQVLFSVLHLGITDYYGRFDKVSGTLNYDDKQPERSSVSISIDTSTVDVPNDRLTATLKSSAVFETQEYPAATFKSTNIVRTGPTTGRISGRLTIRDVTRPVILDATFNGGEQSPLGGYSLGFRATGTIRRSDFGLNHTIWSSFVSDDAKLIISAMFDRQKG